MHKQLKHAPGLSHAPSEKQRFLDDVLQGLQAEQKELPSKYFYDDSGSQLFEQICEQNEYYLTRTELSIMQEQAREMATILGPSCLLIEYGSGNSAKTRLLLDALQEPTAYIPIDISRKPLLCAVASLALTYPDLEVLPVCADYTLDFQLPLPQKPFASKVAYFPGSTLGNFTPPAARHFLRQIATVCQEGGLLIGIDIQKDGNVLHRAYNDSQGITAQFNKHLLERLNQELGANFQVQQFGHYACYNPLHGRVEMHLVSLQDQRVYIGNASISFQRGESIWTESSYKYTLASFARLAASAGWTVERVWMDRQALFSVQYLRCHG